MVKIISTKNLLCNSFHTRKYFYHYLISQVHLNKHNKNSILKMVHSSNQDDNKEHNISFTNETFILTQNLETRSKVIIVFNYSRLEGDEISPYTITQTSSVYQICSTKSHKDVQLPMHPTNNQQNITTIIDIMITTNTCNNHKIYI